jgi:hypothetical protein
MKEVQDTDAENIRQWNESIVLRNVGNLQFATRNNIDDTFDFL